MRRLRNDSGFTMIAAMLTLFIISGLGIGLLTLTDNQQRAAASEQSSEVAFNVAEAALNAQVGQLSRAWPSESAQHYEEVCTAATSTATNGCPSAESLAKGYPVTGSACSKGGTEAWGRSLSNEWTTYVRDDGELGQPASTVYDSTAVMKAPTYDANGDQKVWVRSVGVFNCRVVTLVSLVSEQLVTLPFPESAIAGNWFETENNGNKIIINTQGKVSHSGGVSMRCEGRTEENCKVYRCKEEKTKEKCQVEPNTTNAPPSPSPTLTASQLEAVKITAQAFSRYFEKGNCPTSFAQLAGEPTYIEGPCTLSFKGKEVDNSEESPGFLVIQNGTLTLDGGDEYYGTIYAVNEQQSSGPVVWLKGKSKVVGSIVVDGQGGILFGDSGGKGGGEENENFVFSLKAVQNLRTFQGAAGTRNSFRVLPSGQ